MRLRLALLLGALVAVPVPAAPAPAVDLLITHARVFDGRSGRLRENTEILVAAGATVSLVDNF